MKEGPSGMWLPESRFRAFSEFMELGQKEITTGEKINKLLLCTENKGKPVWLVAA
jgi:hypothetical protein